MTRTRIALGVTLSLWLPAGAGAAQEAANSFDALDRQQLLSAGDSVRITYTVDDQEIESEGRVAAIAPAGIAVELDGRRLNLSESEVREIVRQRPGSALPGVLIGMGIGVPFGMMIGSNISDAGDSGGSPIVTGMVAGGLAGGVGLGLLFRSLKDEDTVFRSPQPRDTASFNFSVVPVFTREQRGVVLALKW